MKPGSLQLTKAKFGKITCWLTSLLGLLYILTTLLGLFSLQSPDDPISDPYFTLMELLTLLIAPLMAISMASVHSYAGKSVKIYSRIALLLIFIMAGITSSVHCVILCMSKQLDTWQSEELVSLFTFEWPSVVYALDILAWDWFFALSMLFAASVFKKEGLEKALSRLMIVSGILSLAGLLGVVLDDMSIRNIGIVGYAVLAPVIFLIMGTVLGRSGKVTNKPD